MSNYKITLPGLEAAANEVGQSLFDYLVLPSGIDKTDLTDNIIIKCNSFEVLYSDIEFMRYAIGSWGRKNYRTFDKWVKALDLEYNPIENYDRIEDTTDSFIRNKKTDDDIQGTNTNSGNSNSQSAETIVDDGEGTNNNTRELKKAAFDSPTYANYEQETDATMSTNDNTRTDNASSNEQHIDTATNASQRDIQEAESTKNTKTSHIHGNIGVTTSQQMLESELKLARFNLYDQITDLFMTEFMVLIYD